MKSLAFSMTLTLLLATPPDAGADDTRGLPQQSVSVQPMEFDDLVDVRCDRCRDVWEAIAADEQEQLTRYLYFELGLSSTGRIELTRALNFFDYPDFSKAGDRVLQFEQADLHGERLLWSYLVNTTNGKALRLFHLSPRQKPEVQRWRVPRPS